MIESLQAFWIQLAPILLEMVIRAKDIFIAPVVHPDLIWVLIPVYINWLLVDFMSTKIEFSNAATTGFTYLWVGTSWLREYFSQLHLDFQMIADNISINVSKFLAVAKPLELGIVLSLFIYGLITMWFSVTEREIGKFMGDIRTMAFLLIVMTPILFRVIPFDIVTVTAILFSAIVFYIITEIIYRTIHLKENNVKDKKD